MNIFDRYLHLIGTAPEPGLLYYGHYSAGLIALSVGMAIFAAYIALLVADLAERTERVATRRLLLTLGGLALGVGIWAMHFVGMLGFSIPCGVSYDPWITGFSMVPGVLASIFSLHLISRRHMDQRTLLLGGTLFGAGIGVMHYAGMAAMRMEALLRYDIKLFLLSIVVAVALAILALWTRTGITSLLQRPSRISILPAAIIMGGAVSGMHYTAMHAAYFVKGETAVTQQSGFDPLTMAIVIAGVTGLFIGIVLIAAFRQILQDMESVKTASDEAQLRIRADHQSMELQSRIKTHVVEISAMLQRAGSLPELAQEFLSRIAPLLNIGYGVLYQLDVADERLHLLASYGYGDHARLQQQIAIGEGLIGQCVLEKAPISLSSPPADYVHIRSGLGDAIPQSIVLQPIMHAGRVLGVLEIAALQPLDEEACLLLEQLMPMLATNLEILARNVRTQQLLDESREQARRVEMQAVQLEEQSVAMEAQQAERLQTEAWLRSIIDAAPEGMLVVDEHGVIVLCNPRLEVIFGYQSGELMGKVVECLLPVEQRQTHPALRAKFMTEPANRLMGSGRQLHGLRQDGSTVLVEVGLGRLPDLVNRGPCVCASVRDLGESVPGA